MRKKSLAQKRFRQQKIKLDYNIFMGSEGTRLQIQTWLENVVRNAQNPSPRERFKRMRSERKKKIAKKYGF